MKNNKRNLFFILSIGFIFQLNAQPSFIWGKQFGTENGESGQGIVCCKSGDIVLAGKSKGNLFSSNLGQTDGFIMKMDSLGKVIWQKQFGTSEDDQVWLLEGNNSGNLYVGGNTNGTIDGIKYGGQDMFIYKFDTNGNLIKSVIIGTDSADYLSKIYIDYSNNIYLAGNTKGKLGKQQFGDWDYFVMKMDSNFTKIFTYQFGTDKWDYCNDFKIAKNGDIYISGFTCGNLGRDNLGNTDAFISKYSKQGDLIKMMQFGTKEAENVNYISIDKVENIYLSGTSHGDIVTKNKGKSDVFVMKLNNKWDKLWEKQYGTSSWDEAWSMKLINSDTELLISGSNNPDAYVRLYDANGTLKWNQVFATRGMNYGTGGRHFSVYQDKYLYFAGFTYGDLFSQNPNQQETDTFILKLGLKNE